MRPQTAGDARYQTGVEKDMNIYDVTYLRDESKWWVASVREALELSVDDAKSATLVDQALNVDL